MTLKEQIQNISITECMAETLEYIADDYAIEFSKWCRINQSINDLNKYSYEELLEIFKKEKGL